jgi:hypothetical protein
MSQESMSFVIQVLTLLIAAVGAYLGFRNSHLEGTLKQVRSKAAKLQEDWLSFHDIESAHCFAQKNQQAVKNKVRKKVEDDKGHPLNYTPSEVKRFDFSG